MEGRMLVPLGVAFIVSLFASTIVALTLTPVLCSYLLGHKAKTGGLPKEAFLAVYLKSITRTDCLGLWRTRKSYWVPRLRFSSQP